MNDSPTEEEVRASIVPKSDQLNADDLLTGPITVTITAVRKGDREQPIIIELEGCKPYKPCKSMLRIIILSFSPIAPKWVGQRMTLFRDPKVLWAGVEVGGIRISHVPCEWVLLDDMTPQERNSNPGHVKDEGFSRKLDKPRTFMLTKTRGKRDEVIVYPLEDTLTPADKKYIDDATIEIQEAESMEVLKALGFILKEKNPAVQDALRGVYAKRQTELK